METSKIKPHLLNSVLVTLENMAFAQVEALQTYWARLKFLEPVKGELFIIFPESLAMELAENIYGMSNDERPLNAKVISDVSAELANMIAGQLMELLLPENESFTLGLPETGTGESVKFDTPVDVFYFSVNGSTLSVGISFEASSEEAASTT